VIGIGYNTNGFPFHTLEEAIRILAGLGYEGIALTPDVHHLNPMTSSAGQIKACRSLLEGLGLFAAVETGARFILDPERKHFPSLMTPGAYGRRQDFLKRCADLAVELGAKTLSIWSGKLEEKVSEEKGLDILAKRLEPVLEHARPGGIRVAIEPEPGMFIDALSRYRALDERMSGAGPDLTIDVGHAHISEASPPEELIAQWKNRIVNVHLDDARNGKHEHLPPGEGEISFEPILRELDRMEREPIISVELSRHGHNAVEQARRTRRFLEKAAGDSS